MAVILGVTDLTGYAGLNAAMFKTSAPDDGRFRGVQLTADADATAESVDFYWDGSYDGSITVKAFLLDSSGTVLGSSSAVSDSTAGTHWVTCTLGSPVSLTNGNTYYVGLLADGTCQNNTQRVYLYTNASGAAIGYQDTVHSGSYTTPPAAFSNLATDGFRWAFRISGTVGSPAVKKLKLLAHSSAAGATGVAGVVFEEPTGGDITGAKIGEFTGESFEASLESGKAVMKVPVADFGGSALTTSDTPVVLVRNATYSTGVIDCTVIEE